MPFYAIVLSLFFILNSLGNIPLFLGILGRYDMRRQRRIIVRESIIALFILLAFNFFGQNILTILGISEPIIGIAGGLVLFIIALGMIFPKREKQEIRVQEPIVVPLATPIIAGPGAIATVMLYSEQFTTQWIMTAAIVVAWIPSTIILLASSNIKHFLGDRGLTACERLGGMLISLIAVQMFTTGMIKIVREACLNP
jgi:MarC family membrane protein